MDYKILRRKVRIKGTLTFDTAFHIGSGREGELGTKMGILQDLDGCPILPGSSLKGSFRSGCERLAPYLNLKTCLLDQSLSGENCVGDESYRRGVFPVFKELKEEAAKVTWLSDHTCDICRLFGSPLQASRIFFSDGKLIDWAGTTQVRDGVCIDRDSETARPKLKYDFEVAPPGARFEIAIDLENPEDHELALVGAVLAEWQSGVRLGGFTSRGLGGAQLDNPKIFDLNYGNLDQLRGYLLQDTLPEAPSLLIDCLTSRLQS